MKRPALRFPGAGRAISSARERARLPNGHVVRIVACGATVDGAGGAFDAAVPLAHVVDFFRTYLRDDWAVLRHAQGFHEAASSAENALRSNAPVRQTPRTIPPAEREMRIP